MKVLFLGAGSSMPVGYPSGRDLLAAVEKHFRDENIDINTRASWQHFFNVRKAALGQEASPLALIWGSSNPEVVASYLDLCSEALDADDDDIESYADAVVNEWRTDVKGDRVALDEQARVVEARYQDETRKPLEQARLARRGLLKGIASLFLYHHFDDDCKLPSGPAYLGALLAQLNDGDVVITTNYDCLVERCLFAQHKWSPRDGYGFDVSLTTVQPGDTPLRRTTSLPGRLQVPSAVTVLKLHGSIGWTRLSHRFGPKLGRLDDYLRAPRLFLSIDLLRPFGSALGVPLHDENEPHPHGGLAGDEAMILPTHLKRTEGREFWSVWSKAADALTRASSVTVIGSSLPAADHALRVLFNPVRTRLLNGVVQVDVQDPLESVCDRWQHFLGASVRCERAGIGLSTGMAT
jgi:hypothetical protein